WGVLLGSAVDQAKHHQESEPAARFLSLLASSFASGRAHVASPDGSVPEDPNKWGWRSTNEGSTPSRRRGTDHDERYGPKGDRIGWVDGDDLYLDRDAAYAVAQAMGSETGEALATRPGTLVKRLRE